MANEQPVEVLYVELQAKTDRLKRDVEDAVRQTREKLKRDLQEPIRDIGVEADRTAQKLRNLSTSVGSVSGSSASNSRQISSGSSVQNIQVKLDSAAIERKLDLLVARLDRDNNASSSRSDSNSGYVLQQGFNQMTMTLEAVGTQLSGLLISVRDSIDKLPSKQVGAKTEGSGGIFGGLFGKKQQPAAEVENTGALKGVAERIQNVTDTVENIKSVVSNLSKLSGFLGGKAKKEEEIKKEEAPKLIRCVNCGTMNDLNDGNTCRGCGRDIKTLYLEKLDAQQQGKEKLNDTIQMAKLGAASASGNAAQGHQIVELYQSLSTSLQTLRENVDVLTESVIKVSDALAGTDGRDDVDGAVAGAAAAANNTATAASEAAADATKAAAEVTKNEADAAATVVQNVEKSAQTIEQRVTAAVDKLVERLPQLGEKALEVAKTGLSAAANSAKSIFETIGAGVKEAVTRPVETLNRLGAMSSQVLQLSESVKQTAANVRETLTGRGPQAQVSEDQINWQESAQGYYDEAQSANQRAQAAEEKLAQYEQAITELTDKTEETTDDVAQYGQSIKGSERATKELADATKETAAAAKSSGGGGGIGGFFRNLQTTLANKSGDPSVATSVQGGGLSFINTLASGGGVVKAATSGLLTLNTGLQAAAASSGGLATAAAALTGPIGAVIGATMAWTQAIGPAVDRIQQMAKEGMELAARVDTLMTGLQVAARNGGQGMEFIEGKLQKLQATGITTSTAINSLMQFMGQKLPVDNIEKLARAGQDLAVARGGNSSEMFNRFIAVINTESSQLLDTVGISKNVGVMVKEWADAHQRSVASLTQMERKGAIIEGLMKETAQYAGLYDASMNSIAKRESSLTRYVEETKLAFGQTLLPLKGMDVSINEHIWKGLQKVFVQTKQITDETGKLKTVPLLGEGGAFKLTAFGEAIKSIADAWVAFIQPIQVSFYDFALGIPKEFMKWMDYLRPVGAAFEETFNSWVAAAQELVKPIVNFFGELESLGMTGENWGEAFSQAVQVIIELIKDAILVLGSFSQMIATAVKDSLELVNISRGAAVQNTMDSLGLTKGAEEFTDSLKKDNTPEAVNERIKNAGTGIKQLFALIASFLIETFVTINKLMDDIVYKVAKAGDPIRALQLNSYESYVKSLVNVQRELKAIDDQVKSGAMSAAEGAKQQEIIKARAAYGGINANMTPEQYLATLDISSDELAGLKGIAAKTSAGETSGDQDFMTRVLTRAATMSQGTSEDNTSKVKTMILDNLIKNVKDEDIQKALGKAGYEVSTEDYAVLKQQALEGQLKDIGDQLKKTYADPSMGVQMDTAMMAKGLREYQQAKKDLLSSSDGVSDRAAAYLNSLTKEQKDAYAAIDTMVKDVEKTVATKGGELPAGYLDFKKSYDKLISGEATADDMKRINNFIQTQLLKTPGGQDKFSGLILEQMEDGRTKVAQGFAGFVKELVEKFNKDQQALVASGQAATALQVALDATGNLTGSAESLAAFGNVVGGTNQGTGYKSNGPDANAVKQQQQMAEQLANAIKEGDKAVQKAREDLDKNLAKLNESLIEKQAELLENLESQKRKAARNYERSLVKFDEDWAKRVLEVQKDNGKQRVEMQKEFDEQQLKAKEDFLASMKRMEEDYGMQLEDAVRSRDAVAVIKMMRQHEVNKRRAQEDFNNRQKDSNDAYNKQLDNIPVNEDKIREKLKDEYDKRKEQMADNYKDQLEQMDENYADQLVELSEQQEKQRRKLTESYDQQVADLKDGNQKKLDELIASWGAQETATTEGVANVLAQVTKLYGPHGDIEQQIAEFKKRRKEDTELKDAISAGMGAGGTSAGTIPGGNLGDSGTGSGSWSASQQDDWTAGNTGGLVGNNTYAPGQGNLNGLTPTGPVSAVFNSKGDFFVKMPTTGNYVKVNQLNSGTQFSVLGRDESMTRLKVRIGQNDQGISTSSEGWVMISNTDLLNNPTVKDIPVTKMALGGMAIADKPTNIQMGEAGREAAMFFPLSNGTWGPEAMRRMIGDGVGGGKQEMDLNIRVRADHNVPPEFADQLYNKIADVVAQTLPSVRTRRQ